MPETKKKVKQRRRDDLSPELKELDRIAISVKSHKLLNQLLNENPKLDEIMRNANNKIEALVGVKNWIMEILENSPEALKYYQNEKEGRKIFEALKWRDYAAIRLLDYIDHAGIEFKDLNLRGEIAISNPIKLIWLGVTYGTGGAKPYFFEDMLQLFRQLSGVNELKLPGKKQLRSWMNRYPSGLDPRIVQLREENKERILRIIIKKIDKGEIKSNRFNFEPDTPKEQKYLKALEWWDDHIFQLNFAVRSPDLLNELLGNSLDPDTMKTLHSAEEVGVPFFVNPYFYITAPCPRTLFCHWSGHGDQGLCDLQ